ncbi:xanthine dehydrogenase family protein subunit M [Xanthomonas sp. PPL139]|uniref:FAD binding domain-containing protein n=1 Tax=unclassified Xanthomonas TaxID=2643310 RepID=UPI0033B807B8
MTPFKYQRATSPEEAVRRVAANPNARFLGGGTNLLDLMKEGVTGADEIVDLTRLKGLAEIAETADGGLRLGALANNTQTANHPLVRQRYPLLSQAILAGATMQLRNMASNGGNLLQRTRCGYFYDIALPCNKREPGSGCGAREGLNRTHAIFGHSPHCVAVHPSDMCVALAALDATVHVRTPAGAHREIPFAEFHLLPDARADLDNQLAHGELIESITLPAQSFAAHSHYLKVRDRASYAFALVSVAAALALEPDGRIREARIAMGGVAHKPWRARTAERALVGQHVGEAAFAAAAQAEMASARPLTHNAYKIPMGTHAMIRALHRASGSDAA